jgi:hypothetical protein
MSVANAILSRQKTAKSKEKGVERRRQTAADGSSKQRQQKAE